MNENQTDPPRMCARLVGAAMGGERGTMMGEDWEEELREQALFDERMAIRDERDRLRVEVAELKKILEAPKWTTITWLKGRAVAAEEAGAELATALSFLSSGINLARPIGPEDAKVYEAAHSEHAVKKATAALIRWREFQEKGR